MVTVDPSTSAHVPSPGRLPGQQGLRWAMQPQRHYWTSETGQRFLCIILSNKSVTMGHLNPGMCPKCGPFRQDQTARTIWWGPSMLMDVFDGIKLQGPFGQNQMSDNPVATGPRRSLSPGNVRRHERALQGRWVGRGRNVLTSPHPSKHSPGG